MFTIPSLRTRECTDAEKDALNLLFLAIPLLNVALPFVWCVGRAARVRACGWQCKCMVA